MLARGSFSRLARAAPRPTATRPLALVALDADFPDVPELAPGAPVGGGAPQLTKLPSGLSVVSTEAGGPIAKVGVYAAVGSRDEGPTLRGAAFMLKHLALKHTAARSDLRMQRALDDMGATTAVEVGREGLLISVSCLPASAGEALAAVAETLTQPRFVPWILKEVSGSKIVQAELAAFAGDAEAQTTQALHEAAFGAESALGGAPIAPGGALSAAQLEGFASCLLSSASMCVVGTGAASHAELVAAASVGFAGLPAGPETAPARIASPYVGGEVRVKADAPLVHVALAGAAPADAAVAAVLKAMPQLGGGGLLHSYDGVGIVGVYGAAPAGQGGALASSLAASLKAASTATDACVAHAKIKAKFAAAAAPELAAMGATALKTGAYAGPPLAAIDAVTPAAVKAAAAELMKAPSMAALGDLTGVPKIAAL